MRQHTPLGRVLLEKFRFPQLFKEFAVLWNLNFLYLVHKEPPLVYFLCEMNPVHTLASSFMLEFSFFLIPSTPRFSSRLFNFKFPYQNPVYFCSVLRATYLAHLILLDLSTLIIFGNYYEVIVQFFSVRSL